MCVCITVCLQSQHGVWLVIGITIYSRGYAKEIWEHTHTRAHTNREKSGESERREFYVPSFLDVLERSRSKFLISVVLSCAYRCQCNNWRTDTLPRCYKYLLQEYSLKFCLRISIKCAHNVCSRVLARVCVLAKVRLISVRWEFSELNTLITSTDMYVIRSQNLFPTKALKKTKISVIIHVRYHYISRKRFVYLSYYGREGVKEIVCVITCY